MQRTKSGNEEDLQSYSNKHCTFDFLGGYHTLLEQEIHSLTAEICPGLCANTKNTKITNTCKWLTKVKISTKNTKNGWVQWPEGFQRPQQKWWKQRNQQFWQQIKKKTLSAMA